MRIESLLVIAALAVAPPTGLPETQTVPAVVAAQPFQFGEKITPNKLQVVRWPATGIPAGTFQSVTAAVGTDERVALRTIDADEPLTIASVSGTESRMPASQSLGPMMRAVSIPITKAVLAGDFIVPGDRVDVVFTRQPQDDQPPNSGLLIRNARVLAVGQGRDIANDTPAVSRSATIEVTPVQAETVFRAANSGTLSLSVHKIRDDNQVRLALAHGSSPGDGTAKPVLTKPQRWPTAASTTRPDLDVLIENGVIYDGSGGVPYKGWVAFLGDRIAGMGRGGGRGMAPDAKRTIDAKGQAIAPGFVNMLSWATETLIADGRAQSDIRQGVTLEVMGEGNSMGPLNAEMKRLAAQRQDDIKFPIGWTSLSDYLAMLENKGIAPNVASFVGATTVRIHELGEKDVDPTPEQLERMRALVRAAMDEGALGVGSSLIYAPAAFAETPELVALATESAKCGGMYISHMRSEGDRIEPAVDELIEIARGSGGPAEIWHMKMSGRKNWGKLDTIIGKIEAARAAGTRITANMYTYTAGATGLDAAMPLWVQAGGLEAWIERLKDPATRARVKAEMMDENATWENLQKRAGSPENVLLLGFKNPKLKPLTGKTLGEVARARGTSPEDTAIDLVIEDGSRVGTAYFLMDEANVQRQIALPWMSFGSDAGAPSAEGVFLLSNDHPRAYGNVARLLGKYVRDEKAATLPDAIRRLTSLPVANLGITDRGLLKPGYFADVVVFDPAAIADHATFAKPAQYATGVSQVFVNGVQVLQDGEPTGAAAGRFVKGSGTGKCRGTQAPVASSPRPQVP